MSVIKDCEAAGLAGTVGLTGRTLGVLESFGQFPSNAGVALVFYRELIAAPGRFRLIPHQLFAGK